MPTPESKAVKNSSSVGDETFSSTFLGMKPLGRLSSPLGLQPFVLDSKLTPNGDQLVGSA